MQADIKINTSIEAIENREETIKKEKKVCIVGIIVNIILIAILVTIIILRGEYWMEMKHIVVPVIYGACIGLDIEEIISHSFKISKLNDESKNIKKIKEGLGNGETDFSI